MKIRNSTMILAVLGVDGSGKTTLIKKLSSKIRTNKKKIKYIHFRPYLFFVDKRTSVKNPHKKEPFDLKIFSIFKLLIWFISYRIFFLKKNLSKYEFVIIDRYIYDVVLDVKRYNLKLSLNIVKKILNFIPKPNLWIILDAPISVLQNRKDELKISELLILKKKYINFAKKKKNSMILNTKKPIQSCLSQIQKKLITINK